METDPAGAQAALDGGEMVLAAEEGLRTVGALDLGGASLEVTFVPARLSEENVKGAHEILVPNAICRGQAS